MMVKVEKVVGGYRVIVGSDVLNAERVNVDDEEVEIERALFIEASEVKVDKDGEVWIYTLLWALDDALFRHENRLIKILKGW
ncbi:MAG: hypothetical protein QW517_09725 [Thermofilaceae archaeon]